MTGLSAPTGNQEDQLQACKPASLQACKPASLQAEDHPTPPQAKTGLACAGRVAKRPAEHPARWHRFSAPTGHELADSLIIRRPAGLRPASDKLSIRQLFSDSARISANPACGALGHGPTKTAPHPGKQTRRRLRLTAGMSRPTSWTRSQPNYNRAHPLCTCIRDHRRRCHHEASIRRSSFRYPNTTDRCWCSRTR